MNHDLIIVETVTLPQSVMSILNSVTKGVTFNIGVDLQLLIDAQELTMKNPPRYATQNNSGLRNTFEAMSKLRGCTIDKNLFFITAWNEWNEQALLEPDSTFNNLVFLRPYKEMLEVSV